MSDLKQNVKDLESVVLECNAAPRGDDLPQVANANDLSIELIHDTTGLPLNMLEPQIYNSKHGKYRTAG